MSAIPGGTSDAGGGTGTIGGEVGTAVGDIFGALGDFAEAGGYSQAAKYAEQEAQYTQLSTNIQEQQAQRQTYQVLGAQQAAVGGAGLSESGSAQDLLHSSTQQATLNKSIIGVQGLVTKLGYEAQASADKAMASASTMGGIGGLISGGLALFGL